MPDKDSKETNLFSIPANIGYLKYSQRVLSGWLWEPGVTEKDRRKTYKKMAAYLQRPNGVYVDASKLNGVQWVGIVQIKSKRIACSIRIKLKTNQNPESEAIKRARIIFPDEKIYSDCYVSVMRHNVNYVPRRENKLAHKCARGELKTNADPLPHLESLNPLLPSQTKH